MEQRQLSPTSEPAAFKQREIPPETLVGSRYKIQQLLGQGGFGRSYLAIDTQRFDERCVLKEFVSTNLSPQVLQKALDLFKREAKTLYQVDHPQIPKFLAGFTQSQRLFIVQEYVNGVTYAQLLRQRQQQAQGFSELEVIQWLRSLLAVLDYLHSLNLIHRDISPDNVMLSHDRGLPVLIDFGLVKDAIAQAPEPDAEDSIRRTSMVGKFGYSPPEQLRMGHCYPSSDLYALGVTAIVLLTGKHPNALIDAETLQWQWQSYVTLKTPLGQVLDKLVMPLPRERFQTAQEVLDMMQRLAIPAPPSPTPIPQPVPTRPVQPFSNSSSNPGFNAVDGTAPTTFPSGKPLTTSAFMQRCQQELAHCVGPIASVLIRDILTQYPNLTPQGFIETLTSHISDPGQAREFKRRIHIPPELIAEGSLFPASGSRTSQPPVKTQLSPMPGETSSESPPASNSALMEQCQQALVRYIGPISNLLIKNVLADNPHVEPALLIEILAAQIPDARKAAAFRQELKNLL